MTMNIEQIRAEIPDAFSDFNGIFAWIVSHGMSEYSSEHSHLYDIQTAARMLVDRAFEAGKAAPVSKDSYSAGWEAGFEAGHNDAAKDFSTWYVDDKSGNPTHIGDKVFDSTFPKEEKFVYGFAFNRCEVQILAGANLVASYSHEFEKVGPDSWEKFAQDLSDQLVRAALGRLSEEEKSPDEIAEAFAERAREMLGDPGC